MEIRPDLHWIEGRSSNIFLCVADDGLTLVDAGMPGMQDDLFAEIQRLGYRPTDLKWIFITHADIDHVGSLAVIQTTTGAKVFAGEQTAVLLQKGKSPQHLPRPMQWFVNAFVRYKKVTQTAIQVRADGDLLPGWGELQVINTPGHTLDHISFYSSTTGVLFAGDALNTRADCLQRTPPRITANEDLANQSAIELLKLTPTLFACGHGRPLQEHSTGELIQLFNQLRNAA